MFDAYSLAPAGLPHKALNADAIANSCTQICLPQGVSKVAGSHGVRFGGNCFGENNASANPFYFDGSPIPEHTPVCPGAQFVHEDSTAGVQYFTYKCTSGDVINYGGPYK
jgi:hypothetical protein